MLALIHVLIGLAAVLFLIGTVVRFVRRQEGTVWWRGAIGLLLFANTLLLLQIYNVLSQQP